MEMKYETCVRDNSVHYIYTCVIETKLELEESDVSGLEIFLFFSFFCFVFWLLSIGR